MSWCFSSPCVLGKCIVTTIQGNLNGSGKDLKTCWRGCCCMCCPGQLTLDVPAVCFALLHVCVCALDRAPRGGGGVGGEHDAAYTADRQKMVSLHMRCESCNADDTTRKPGSAPPCSSFLTSSFT